jgi:hypothetical protein
VSPSARPGARGGLFSPVSPAAGSHNLQPLGDAGRAWLVYLRPRQVLAGEEGGDVFGADAVKMQVKAAGQFTPGFGG